MKKRGMIMGLSLCLILCLLAGQALASEGGGTGTPDPPEQETPKEPDTSGEIDASGGKISWALNTRTGELTLNGTGGIPNYDASSDLDNPTNNPAPWSPLRDQIKSVTIAEGITAVGEYAFSNYPNMTSVSLPGSITELGGHAFQNSANLQTLTLPNKVARIGAYAFSGCAKLRSLNLPSSLSDIGIRAFSGCAALTTVAIPEKITSVPEGAFSGCTGLTGVSFPEGLASIGAQAFQGCTRLRPGSSGKLTLPSALETIGDSAFSGCTGMTAVLIPSTVTRIGANAFEGSGLVSTRTSPVLIPCAAEIGTGAFDNCSNLSEIHYCGSYSDWGTMPVGGAGGKEVAIHYNITLTVDKTTHYTCNENLDCYREVIATCKECGQIIRQTETLPRRPHVEISVPEVPATCESSGLTAGTKCENCDRPFSGLDYIEPLGHEYRKDPTKEDSELVDPVLDTEKSRDATCLAGGLKVYYRECQRPGCEHKEEIGELTETLSPLGHLKPTDDSEIIRTVKSEPTCSTKGIMEVSYLCARGEKCSTPTTRIVEEEEIDFDTTKHNPDNGVDSDAVPATCTKDGSKTVTVTCRDCHAVLSVTPETIDALGHTKPKDAAEIEEKVTKPAQCGTPGEKEVTFTCTVCKEKVTLPEEIPATGEHKVEVIPGKAATCMESGLTEGQKCSECQTVLVAQKNIPIDPKGHVPEEAVEEILTPADCEKAGSKKVTVTCKLCHKVLSEETVEIPALEHEQKEGTEGVPGARKEPDCGNPGFQMVTYECVRGHTYTKTEILPATGQHTFGEWTTVTPPTALTPGSREHTCSVCGKKETEELPATGVSGPFTVTLDANGGTLSGDVTTMQTTAGGLLTEMPADPTRTGYTLKGWYTAKESGTRISTSFLFTEDTTIYAQWTGGSTDPDDPENPGETFTVTVSRADHGAVTPSASSVLQGATVTLAVSPDTGYQLSTIRATDAGGAQVALTRASDSRYTFVMPASNVTVTASFVRDSSSSGDNSGGSSWDSGPAWNPSDTPVVTEPVPVTQSVPQAYASGQIFLDIPATHWAAGEIAWTFHQGYMNGTGGGNFSPDRPLTHRQLWTVLSRLLSNTNISEANRQTVRAGLLDGGNPDGPATRQELVAALHRCAYLMGGARTPNVSISQFADSALVSNYAKEAMAWAVTNGIISGTADRHLNPTFSVSRAQFAVILYRFSQRS